MSVSQRSGHQLWQPPDPGSFSSGYGHALSPSLATCFSLISKRRFAKGLPIRMLLPLHQGHVAQTGHSSLFSVFLQLRPRKASLVLWSGEERKVCAWEQGGHSSRLLEKMSLQWGRWKGHWEKQREQIGKRKFQGHRPLKPTWGIHWHSLQLNGVLRQSGKFRFLPVVTPCLMHTA